MEPRIPIAAITDEFSPNLAPALDVMEEIGMTTVELRVVNGKNILDLTDDELTQVAGMLGSRGFRTISIASPLMKCLAPGGGEVDSRFQHDLFASKHTYDDQPRLTDRAFAIAGRLKVPIIRVFSYWRTTTPERTHEAILRALEALAIRAAKENVTIGIENEHACNIGTAEETATLLAQFDHPNLKIVWDPANAFVAGENSFPEGYSRLPKHRIAHVHAKDCVVENHKPEWGPLGTRAIDWKGQIAALLADNYKGYLSLETHWPGPGGNKLEGSRICGWNLKGLASA
jgi:L-ribulose-5-phosphate 3-epimerase